MVQNIDVIWDGPFDLREKDWDGREFNRGIYQIVRTWAGTETLLYIGKTWRQDFGRRMDQHWADWARGHRSLRAYVGNPTPKDRRYRTDRLVVDVESLLIYHHQPPNNVNHVYLYKGRPLHVRNLGFRGLLDRNVRSGH